MRIGIDVSQLAYENTGVASYLKHLVSELLKKDKENEYVLFFSSLRRSVPDLDFLKLQNVSVKRYKFPPVFLNILWNKLHIFPIEWLIGDVDIFVTSDWTEPPTVGATKATILYDLIVYKYPKETSKKIVKVQKRKLKWVKKESKIVFCISEATMKDAQKILKIHKSRLHVLYPGL